jgi:hypothetical protein
MEPVNDVSLTGLVHAAAPGQFAELAQVWFWFGLAHVLTDPSVTTSPDGLGGQLWSGRTLSSSGRP